MPGTLQTRRLLLEPWHEQRIEHFIGLTADDRVMRYLGAGRVWTRAEAIERFRAAADHWRVHGFGWRSVIETASGEWVGLIALNRLGPGIRGVDEDETEIGWWLMVDAWHRGIATEGARAACAEAFTRLGVTRLIARCRPANERSLAVMGRLGMAAWHSTVGRHGEEVSLHALDRTAWLRCVGTPLP
jgi:RimJ/RimL family protein N-acetyltransferase